MVNWPMVIGLSPYRLWVPFQPTYDHHGLDTTFDFWDDPSSTKMELWGPYEWLKIHGFAWVINLLIGVKTPLITGLGANLLVFQTPCVRIGV